MKRSELRDRIERNLTAAGLIIDDLRLQPDHFRGWHVVIVSPGFAGLSDRERREAALKGLEGETFQWVDLLTPEEREWAGDLPIDSDLEDLPMWPEALARAQTVSEEPVIFPSDLDEDLPRPIVASFYSLRGGVGRSTALAYTAQILASRGHSVLCVDMDLEAPALAALFGKEDEIREGQGLVSILLALDQGEKPDIVQHIIRLSDSDELYCLPAGIPNADYARRLRLLDPEGWYREERNPLRALLDGISTTLPFRPDLVLMDARTGISPMSAPLLFDLSDLAIVTFFPHLQSYMGTRALVQAILRAHSRRERDGQKLTPEPRFLVSPVPASKAPEVQQRYRLRAIAWIADWLTPLVGRREVEAPPVEPEEITHFVPYQESIATSDTRNWVWNRLADGKGDHSPRALLQLFREATTWEQEEHPKTPYDRTVIRPRALIASLNQVSDEALSALREEFEELNEIEKRLRDLGRSPVDASEFGDLGEQLMLAREVGLVEIYEGTEEEVRRYRIPDLYRRSLGMTRQGSA
ncbi:MAG: ParA family protein [Candidatus Entotheonellia bacterium]